LIACKVFPTDCYNASLVHKEDLLKEESWSPLIPAVGAGRERLLIPLLSFRTGRSWVGCPPAVRINLVEKVLRSATSICLSGGDNYQSLKSL
jgi:hypothetical protein